LLSPVVGFIKKGLNDSIRDNQIKKDQMKKGICFEETKDGFGGIYFIYEAGGRYEKKGFRGVSHLAEHIKCKKEKIFSRELNTLCLNTNAVTGDNAVIFFCTGLEENVAKFSKKYFSCFDFEPTEKEFEAEKLIIIQEIESLLNDYTLGVSYERGMYGYGGGGGFLEDVKSVSYKDFMSFYREMLGKPSAVVFVGDKNIKKVYSHYKNYPVLESDRRKISFKMAEKPDESLYEAWSSKSTAMTILFSKTKEKSMPACQFLSMLLSDGLYSPLYRTIREEKNLVYYLGLNANSYGSGNVFEFSTETSKLGEVKDTFFDILKNFSKYVSRQDYEDYVEKTLTMIRQMKMKKNSLKYVQKEYQIDSKDVFNVFDPKDYQFSYENMEKLCKKISDRRNWKSMTHFKKRIDFTDKI